MHGKSSTISKAPGCLMLLAVLLLCLLPLAAQQTGTTTAPASQSEAIAFAKNMGIGWNLGNTLEACGDWIDKSSISNFEIAWGSPLTTNALFHSLKAAGISTVRIPVAWSNLMAPDYTISPALMDRVAEVVGFALDEGMYVILNLHWDGGWIAGFSTDYDKSLGKYKAIWTQVGGRFKDAPDRLIFESLNEEGCFNDVWNRYSDSSSGKKKAYAILNGMNQEFTTLIRSSGGNNGTRYLLMAGYATDIDLTCDPLFRMPEDPVRHSMVSVHYYSPPTFAILEKDADWGKAARTWGSPAEQAALKADMAKVKTRFVDQGIPVILGEYGAPTKGKDRESVYTYLSSVAQTAWDAGLVPVLWDANSHFDRKTLAFKNKKLADFYAALAQKSR